MHPSNFRIEGFTERPTLQGLCAAAREASIPLVEDLGSGCLIDGLAGEPTVQASVAGGADLVCFSGDKLLGGPQAGIVVGRRDLIDRLRRHPLMRALRVDKLTLAALEATLLEYAEGRAAETVPVVRMISTDADAIEARAQALAEHLHRSGLDGGDRERGIGHRRRQRAGRGAPDGAASPSSATDSRPMIWAADYAPPIRRSSRASNTTASSSICGR